MSPRSQVISIGQAAESVRDCDLVLRHALDVDETGSRLMFGSTTGSLWISENGGDSWDTLSANLPPVYAVRFEKPIQP